MNIKIGIVSHTRNSYGFIRPVSLSAYVDDYYFHFSLLKREDMELLYGKPIKHNRFETYKNILPGKPVVFEISATKEIVKLFSMSYIQKHKTDDDLSLFFAVLKQCADNKNACKLYTDHYRDKKGNIHYSFLGYSTGQNVIDIKEYVYGPEYYLIEKYNFDINNKDTWLKYMELNNPKGNIVELFISRFFDSLKENNCNNELFEQLLYAYNRKWRTWSISDIFSAKNVDPVLDDFAALRDNKCLIWKKDKLDRYNIYKPADEIIMQIIKPFAEGELTIKQYNLLNRQHREMLSFSMNKHYKTWNNPSSYTYNVHYNSITEIIEEFFKEKEKLTTRITTETIKAILLLNDEYVKTIRKVCVPLLCDYPTPAEFKRQAELCSK